jgi:hypothetical protein
MHDSAIKPVLIYCVATISRRAPNADYELTADREIAVTGLRRTAASSAAS